MIKKFLLLVFCISPIYSFAMDLCARDDTMVFVLDGVIEKEKQGYSGAESIWWVDFAFGRISGEMTCLSGEESKNTNIEAGLYGTDENGNERRQCWCRMTHPFLSDWVPNNGTESAEACERQCTCDYYVGLPNSGLRKKLFDSVGR